MPRCDPREHAVVDAGAAPTRNGVHLGLRAAVAAELQATKMRLVKYHGWRIMAVIHRDVRVWNYWSGDLARNLRAIPHTAYPIAPVRFSAPTTFVVSVALAS